jgi:dolichyl-phosphate-mannose--protein O-mannosyl transferase
MWWVRPAYHGKENTEYPQRNDQPTCQAVAQPIMCGDIIRLTNVGTSRMLHSHDIQSPLSKQQEVSIFEGDDSGNNFKVECLESNDHIWRRGESVHLLHIDTWKYLGGSKDAEFNVRTCGQNCPLMNNLEAFARGAKDALGAIQAEQGIYLRI